MYTTWPNLTWSWHEQFTWGEFFGEFPILNDIIQSRVRIHHERFNIFFASFFLCVRIICERENIKGKICSTFPTSTFLGIFSSFIPYFFVILFISCSLRWLWFCELGWRWLCHRRSTVFSRSILFFSWFHLFFFQFQFNSHIYPKE